eukprot:scaffold8126_cov170-Amphora_coffeaeformis.AAC.1
MNAYADTNMPRIRGLATSEMYRGLVAGTKQRDGSQRKDGCRTHNGESSSRQIIELSTGERKHKCRHNGGEHN